MRSKRSGVRGKGPEKGNIIFLYDTPSYEDKIDDKPLSGNRGRFFNWALGEAGILRHQVWVTTIVSQPTTSDLEFESLQEEEDEEFLNELEFLKNKGFNIIVPMGNTAAKKVNITDSLDKARGSVYSYGEFIVIPTFHPGEVHGKGIQKKDKSRADMKMVWIADIQKAVEIAKNGWKPPEENFNIFPTIEEAEEFFEYTYQNNIPLALDIETTGFNRDYAEIVMIGFAYDDENALVMPFLTQGGGPYWRNGNIKKADALIRKVLKQQRFILQNALYDVSFLRDKGYDFSWDNVEHDTMLLHHAISPEHPHNLGFIVSVYGKTPYWKEEFLSKQGKITDMPDADARTYNARDCVVLHQILPGLLEDLRNDEAEETYFFESKPLLRVVGDMMERGVKFSQKNLDKWVKHAKEEKNSLENELRHLGNLPNEFSLTSDEDLRWFFFGVPSSKFKKLYTLEDYKERNYVKYLCTEETCQKRTYWVEEEHKVPACPKCNQIGTKTTETKRTSRKKKDTKAYADLLALEKIYQQTESIYIPNGFTGRRTQKSNKIAVNQQGLLSLQRAAQNRIRQINSLKKEKESHQVEKNAAQKLLTFLDKYFSFTALQKNLSTYSSFKTRKDGRVHPSFLIHGTATGRLACRDPNLMNIPKKMKGIRNGFISDDNYVLMAVDYVNLEIFVLAYVTGDEKLIKMIKEGMNIHDENTKTLFGLNPNDEKWDLARRAAKVFMFGGISYGGSDNEIYEKIILAAPELGITLAEYQQAKRRFMEAHPGYAEWAARIKQEAKQTRKSITPLGRVRVLTGMEKDIEKQALNTPIQGGAAGIINRASVRIHDRMEKMKSGLILQVHDELIAEVHKDEVLDVFDIMTTEMTQPIEINNEDREFRVDVEIGKTWGDLKEITRNNILEKNYDI